MDDASRAPFIPNGDNLLSKSNNDHLVPSLLIALHLQPVELSTCYVHCMLTLIHVSRVYDLCHWRSLL